MSDDTTLILQNQSLIMKALFVLLHERGDADLAREIMQASAFTKARVERKRLRTEAMRIESMERDRDADIYRQAIDNNDTETIKRIEDKYRERYERERNI